VGVERGSRQEGRGTAPGLGEGGCAPKKQKGLRKNRKEKDLGKNVGRSCLEERGSRSGNSIEGKAKVDLNVHHQARGGFQLEAPWL